jgi:hypothetical protein
MILTFGGGCQAERCYDSEIKTESKLMSKGDGKHWLALCSFGPISCQIHGKREGKEVQDILQICHLAKM